MTQSRLNLIVVLSAILSTGCSTISPFFASADNAAAELGLTGAANPGANTDRPKAAQSHYRIEQSDARRTFLNNDRLFVMCDAQEAPSKTECGSITPKTPYVVQRAVSANRGETRTSHVPANKTFSLGFEYDKDTLQDQSLSAIGEAALYANANRASLIRVEGRADSFRRDAYNLDLAKRRAQAVAHHLRALKVSAQVVTGSSIARTNERGELISDEAFHGRRVEVIVMIPTKQ